MREGSLRSRVRTLLTCRSTGKVTSSAAMVVETWPSRASSGSFCSGSSFPGGEPVGDGVLSEEDRHAVVDLAAGVPRLARDDGEGDVPAVAVLGLAGSGEAGGVQQLPVGVVDEEGVLATVVGLDPLVVARHGHDGAAARKRAAEHAVGRDRLQARVDRARPLSLRPRGVQPPACELETPLTLTVVVNELAHHRCLGARRDAVDRITLPRAVLLSCDVGVEESLSVEL